VSIKRVHGLANIDTFRRLVEMVRPPAAIASRHAVIIFSRRMVGTELLGVVLAVESKKLWIKRPKSVLPVLSVTLHLSKSGGVVQLHLRRRGAIHVGDVIVVMADERSVEHGRVLYADTYRVVKPPA
jgi:hypothetical protein